MGLEFNPLVVVGAAALCCAFVSYAVARSRARVVFIDTLNHRSCIIEQRIPELSDLISVTTRNDVSWRNLQVSTLLFSPLLLVRTICCQAVELTHLAAHLCHSSDHVSI